MSIYNTPLEERFGEKLEELREGKNMTREQLADQVGLTARHIAALERGERRPDAQYNGKAAAGAGRTDRVARLSGV